MSRVLQPRIITTTLMTYFGQLPTSHCHFLSTTSLHSSAISEQLLRIAGGGGEEGRGQGQGDGAVAMTVVAADVRPSRLLVGSHGEILDMVAIPMSTLPSPSTPPPSSSSSSSSAVTSNSSDVAAVATLRFRLALVTNSPQLRIVDERFSCTVLEGHRDIVLAVDVSPDG